jgi:ATP-dependent Clp protease ATP-binding subunit ClpC
MFEKFTDRARRVIVLAQEEARMLSHNYIGTEHLLLGVVAVDGEAAVELAELGVTEESVKQELDRQIAKIQALRARRAGGAQL